MSQVDKLKELLFQPESEAIAHLSKRVEDVFDRAGTEARFEASVARSIDGALRAAEVAKHDEVASALAPLVVRTVKTEIVNSTDELVEALYPATGRMVKAYVANAIKELTDKINSKLEENPLLLRLSAWTSGQSAGEMALAHSHSLQVEDVFLIRRATGELLGRWPQPEAGSSLDHVFGGVLTAINEFTAEAFKSPGSSLREINLGEQHVYLRVSPNYLLAARCSGTQIAGAGQIFDDQFLAFVDRSRGDLDAASEAATKGTATTARDFQPMLKSLSERLQHELQSIALARATLRRGVRPLSMLAVLIGIPLAVWLAWAAYVRYSESQVVETARGLIEVTPEMLGYPTEVRASDGATSVTISGLAPSAEVEAQLLRKIRAALPAVRVHDKLNTLPAGVDFRPAIAALKQDQTAFEAQVATATESQIRGRASTLLTRAANVLQREAWALGGEAGATLEGLAREAGALASNLSPPSTIGISLAAEQAAELEARISATAQATLDINAPATGEPIVPVEKGDVVAAAVRVAFAAQSLADRSTMKRRLAAETATLKADAMTLRADADALKAEVARLAAPKVTPREALAAFVRSHAIFFSEGVAFRDPAAASDIIDRLATLMAKDTSLVRISGYTDDAGSPATNIAIAQARADAVASALIARGVPANRLVMLRRTSPEYNVSPASGTGSSNRRVEFEIGFVGEGGGG